MPPEMTGEAITSGASAREADQARRSVPDSQAFQRRGGRKHIVARYGSETGPPAGRTVVRALARVWRWQKLLDGGVCITRDHSRTTAHTKSFPRRGRAEHRRYLRGCWSLTC
jgi:hypothetical protein